MLKNSDGLKIVVGIDEAGRGCLAGPVVAAAVCMPISWDDYDIDPSILNKIKDSKKMTKKNRNICRQFIEDVAIDWAVGIADNDEIDKVNILRATHNAMHNALDQLNIIPDMILVDGNSFKDYYDPSNELVDTQCIIGGDNKYLSIACASILAKEYHDKMIKDIVANNPELELDLKYGWNSNVCYGTETHRKGIAKWGISKYHRKTFGICNDS